MPARTRTPIRSAIIPIKGDLGQVYSSEHKLKAFFRKSNIQASTRIEKGPKRIIVEGQITQEELDAFLSSSKIPYTIVEYQKEDRIKQADPKKVPSGYGQLIGEVKQLRGREEEYKIQIAQLEQKIEEQKRIFGNTARDLEKQVRDLKAECDHVPTIQDTTQKIMREENKLWESFVEFYDDVAKTYSELGGISVQDLECQLIDYTPLTARPEYKTHEEEFDKARQFREAAKINPDFIQLAPKAKGLLFELEKLEKEDDAVKSSKEEVEKQTGGKVMRIVIGVEPLNGEEVTYLTLPFRYRNNGEYHRLELPLIGRINQTLDVEQVQYTTEDFNGLLRYTIRDIKTRARNRLIKSIKERIDVFTLLGGQRKPIAIDENL